jgi:hypothetical protein
LCFIDGNHSLHGFDLDDNKIIDEQIKTKSAIDNDVSVVKRYRHLPFDGETSGAELVHEALFINRLQQPRTKGAMNGKSRIDDLARNPFMFGGQFDHLRAFASSRLVHSSLRIYHV